MEATLRMNTPEARAKARATRAANRAIADAQRALWEWESAHADDLQFWRAAKARIAERLATARRLREIRALAPEQRALWSAIAAAEQRRGA